MTATFVRHGQSLGNGSGSIDSSTPRPVLSELGYRQAAAVAAKLGNRNYDGVYASSMVRTQLTAAPMSQYLGLPVQVIDGLQEIEARDLAVIAKVVNKAVGEAGFSLLKFSRAVTADAIVCIEKAVAPASRPRRRLRLSCNLLPKSDSGSPNDDDDELGFLFHRDRSGRAVRS
jgi:Histidine phosphatase superfamily (branch 1)